LQESAGVVPQLLVPPFKLAGKEFGAVAAIDRQSARALGGDARADGQQWGRSIVWAPRVPPPLMAAVWRLLSLDFVEGLCSLSISMAGAGARASFGAMGAAMGGRSPPQERSAKLLQFRLIWDTPTDQSAAWCARVETRPCGKAATGVVQEAVEATRVVCSRRLGSARPRDGTECARVAVGGMHMSRACVRCVCMPCGCLQVKSRPGQSSLCTLPIQPEPQCMVVAATWCIAYFLKLF
jgi:hypothetical protein